MKGLCIERASEFGIASILGRSFTILSSAPGVFLTLAFLSLLPGSLVNAYVVDDAKLWLTWTNFFMGLLTQGAFAHAVSAVMKGERPSFGEAVGRGTARIFALWGAAILSGIGVAFGMLLFIIPGLILLCMWAVAVPACVVEELGPVESLKRSAQLTRGYRFSIFALALVAMLAIQIAMRLAILIAALLLPVGAIAFSVAFVFFGLIAPQAYSLIIATTIYYDLRVAHGEDS